MLHAWIARAAVAALGTLAAGAFAQDAPPRLPPADYVKATVGSVPTGGLKRVAIPTFMVHLVRDQGIERSGGSLGMFMGQSASFFTQVRGAEPVLQRIADTLYDQLVADLQAAGVEVVPTSQLDAQADYQEIRKVAKPSPSVVSFETGAGRSKHMSSNVIVTARGLPVFTRNVIDDKWLTGQAFPGEGLQGMTLVLGAGKVAQAVKAPMLNVRLALSLVEQKGKGWGGVSSRPDFVLNRWVKTAESRWEFETDPYARFVEDGTTFAVTNLGADLAPNPVVLRLKQPVPIAGLELAGVKGEGGNARGSGLLGALGRAVTGAENQPADLYIDVTPENFAERVIAEGKPVLRSFVEALTAAR